MPIGEDAMPRNGSDRSAMSEFAKPEHHVNTRQAGADEGDRCVLGQSLIRGRQPGVMTVDSAFSSGFVDARKHGWIKVSSREHHVIGLQCRSVIQQEVCTVPCAMEIEHRGPHLFDSAGGGEQRSDIPAKNSARSKGAGRCCGVEMLTQPVQEVIRLQGQGADLACRHIQQVPQTGCRVGQPQTEFRTRVDQHDLGIRLVPEQVKCRQRTAYTPSDNGDCLGLSLCCVHVQSP